MSFRHSGRALEHSGTATATTRAAPGKQSLVQQRYAGAPAVQRKADAAGTAQADGPVPVITTASRLRVRSQPSTDSKDNIVGSLAQGTRVEALGRQGNWLRIEFEGQPGFIHGGYTRPAESKPPEKKQEPTSGPTGTLTSGPEQAFGSGSASGSAASGDAFGFASLFTWLSDAVGKLMGEDAVEDQDTQEPNKGAADDEQKSAADDEQQNGATDPDNVDLDDESAGAVTQADLAALVAELNNPYVTDMANDLAALQTRSAELWDDRSAGEERGKGRDELVAAIGALRDKIAGVDGAGLAPARAAQLKQLMYRAVHEVAPYYAQGTNIDLLEGKAQAEELGTETTVTTRTCNITSLAMALESLGKSPADYTGKSSKIDAIAKVFSSEAGSAKMTVGKGVSGMRLSDFMQFAAIAEQLGSDTSKKAVTAAAVSAWSKILSIGFLKTLASRFGTSGSVKLFSVDANATSKEKESETYKLRKFGKKHRKATEKLVDARNKWEESGSDKDKAAYDKLKKPLDDALVGDGIEDDIGIEAYKSAVIEQIGAEMDGGSAVVVLLSGHYVRLQAIHDDHCVVDDPGRKSRANRKVLWPEARAMGYFSYRLVLG